MTQPRRRPARFSRPRTPHPPKQRSGPSRPPVDDPARQAALDTLREVRARDAYANLLLPQILRERRITGRDAALATELAYGACRFIGLLDEVLDAVHRPAAGQGRARAARRAAARLLPAAAHPDPAARGRRVDGGPGARRARLAQQRVRERRAAQGVRADRGRTGWTSWRRTRTRTASATSPCVRRTRAGWPARSPTRSARRARSWSPRWPPTTSGPPCTSWPGRARSPRRSWPP